MIKRNIYKWHRSLSILIAIPVIMWTVSGIMHPIMTSFKPDVKKQFIKREAIDSAELIINLKDALIKNGIKDISNFNIVKLDTSYYYQVKTKNNDRLSYLSAIDGSLKSNADSLYGIQLAKKILGDDGAVIKDVSLVRDFTDEYVYVNRYLPVYKISFDREDGIRIYIDTFGSRMALAMNDSRAGFNKFFINFHSWGFLDYFGKLRLVVIVLLIGLAFITTCMGITIWVLISRKNKNSSEKTKYRRLHSRIAIFTSITTLMFTFSGCYHAFHKFTPDTSLNYFFEPSIAAEKLSLDVGRVQQVISDKAPLENISVAEINGNCYWQLSFAATDDKEAEKVYLNTTSYQELENGDVEYATFLANRFSKNKTEEVSEIELITGFGGEYGFVNKRLPVLKIQYSKNDNERYYIETATSKLSTKIQDKDLYEGLSFAFLHKFHFLEALGKTGRDIATVVAASANLLVTLTGILLFVRFMRNRRQKK